MSTRPTINEFVGELLQRVHYTDMHGRKVGYDFHHMLAMIKKKFPASRTTYASLRICIKQQRAAKQIPMPSHPKVRKGSRRRAAHDFTRALLVQRDANGHGLGFEAIKLKVRKAFPGEQRLSLPHAERMLAYRHPGLVPEIRP